MISQYNLKLMRIYSPLELIETSEQPNICNTLMPFLARSFRNQQKRLSSNVGLRSY